MRCFLASSCHLLETDGRVFEILVLYRNLFIQSAGPALCLLLEEASPAAGSTSPCKCLACSSTGGQCMRDVPCLCLAQLSRAGGTFTSETLLLFPYLKAGNIPAVDTSITLNHPVSL